MKKVLAVALIAGLLGYHAHFLHIAITWGEASAQTVQTPPARRAVPAWSVYQGAHSCTMTGPSSVACDNGYSGPQR
jgi:hypothetical protein